MKPQHPPIKIAFLVRALDFGGAQRQLISLAKALAGSRFSVSVLTFYSGQLEQELSGSDVQVISLNKRGRWDLPGFLWRLIKQVRVIRPAVVHGYLDIPNLLALILKLFVRTRVVWGLRSSTIELEHYDWLRSLAANLEQRCSRWADLIIINSASGLAEHVARGFPRERMVVIPNGFATSVFKPDQAAGERLRALWNVPSSAKLVGVVGRLDPMKDHQNFLQAAALVLHRSAEASHKLGFHNAPDVHFVCVGDGPAGYRDELKKLANDLGLAGKLSWQNATSEIAAVYNALDLLVSCSRAEGLSNVIGEAMACGVPCVVTDVGDSRLLIGECGVVVPPQDSIALAEGIIRCLTADRNELGGRARARIVEQFSTEQLAELTETAITSLVKREPQ